LEEHSTYVDTDDWYEVTVSVVAFPPLRIPYLARPIQSSAAMDRMEQLLVAAQLEQFGVPILAAVASHQVDWNVWCAAGVHAPKHGMQKTV